MIKKRTIAVPTALKVREVSDGVSRTIEGYALKFDERSKLLCDWWNDYYEVLERGCITDKMLREQDIILTMFHDRQLLLARNKEGQGTLNYELDETGVKFWAEMPETVDGDKALELVKRGDITGCSFCYSTDEEDSENAVSYERIQEDGRDVLLRHVKRIDHIYDFTITPSPAYEQTSVTRREVESTGVLDNEEDQSEEDQPEESKVDEKKKREFLRKFRREINRSRAVIV